MLDQLDGELERRVLAISPAVTEHAAAAGRSTGNLTRASTGEEVAAARLRQLERLLRTQEDELRRQEREIAQLQADKVGLQRDNREMQLFLADYGMRWVGGHGDASAARTGRQPSEGSEARGAGAASRAACDAAPSCASVVEGAGLTSPPRAACVSPSGSSAPAGGSAPPDVHVVRRAVHELNELADSSAEVVRRGDGSHGIQISQPTLDLIFWSNGMQVQGGELRPYGAPQSASDVKPPSCCCHRSPAWPSGAGIFWRVAALRTQG